MNTTCRLAVLAAAAFSLVMAGCGTNKCPTENPKISGGASGVPVCTGAAAVQAGATVTVSLRTCPTCNQTTDVCTVLPAGSDGIIQLDPLVQACTSSSSCPPSCNLQPTTCTFTAPSTPGSYQILVYDPGTGGPIQQPFEVVASGGARSCG
jgi:hypothetical protein